MGLFVIWPRGSTNRKRGAGVVDADRIYQFKSVADFISRCAVIADSELREEIRTFIFDRSRINYLKYKWLRRSITLSCIGWTGAIILCVVLKLHPLLNQHSALSLENLRMKMHERFFSSQDEFFVII